ncbi:uncharacterized protein CTRU02_203251 [Colletotrichum truncatum]|uniref:Uncharacterized protein n=1 Tax=Colletotrichum truncatum TaxID=5467 RepID=A0ACC3Z8T2_COLTU|nr:uncharacterized protein CTRU02_09092 [Colletotrichum truncatum]KAF6789300.1 hypothetical protein CTRU02_09092 [Colletotrichum truncatum]
MQPQFVVLLSMLTTALGSPVELVGHVVSVRAPPANTCPVVKNARWHAVNGGEVTDDICFTAEEDQTHTATINGPTGGGGRNNVVLTTTSHRMHDISGETFFQYVANMQNNMGHAAEFYASTSQNERGGPVVIQPGQSAAHIGYVNDYIQQLFLSIKWLGP